MAQELPFVAFGIFVIDEMSVLNAPQGTGPMEVQTKKTTSFFDVHVGQQKLPGTLALPENALGVVVFAHGSGSSRLSPRNQMVAQHLQSIGLATLLFDLLHEHESQDRGNVFDIELLSERLTEAIDWLAMQNETAGLPVGLFGASTGSAAALMAASKLREAVAAVVSRGGRPDLAGDLEHVQAPTLLIVGGEDPVVIELNQLALRRITCKAKLVIVPGATHLFSEPGTLEQVARLASEWFQIYLKPI